jgi:uroporphyrinogen-III synthase
LKTLAVTRPLGEGDDTAEFIRQLGWQPFIFHTVELKPRDTEEVFSELKSLISEGPVDYLVFMSPKGVSLLFDVLKTHGSTLPGALGQMHIVAVGPKTREALLNQGVRKVLMPEDYSSAGVAGLLSRVSLKGKRVILGRSSEADDTLAKASTAKGATVRTLQLYNSSTPSNRDSVRMFLEGLGRNLFQGILFTSAVSVSNLFEMARGSISSEDIVEHLTHSLVGAIGPATAERLQELGIGPHVVPARHLISEAVTALVQAYEAGHASATIHLTEGSPR